MPTRQELEIQLANLKDRTKCLWCNKPLKDHSLKDLEDCLNKIWNAEREAESMEV